MELKHAKHSSRAQYVRFSGKSTNVRNFGFDISVHPPVQTVRVGRIDSDWEWEFLGNFPSRAALHLATHVFLAGDHIDHHRFFKVIFKTFC